MCISNDVGAHKSSSVEVDGTIPTDCKKQDQGHRLLSVEISHRDTSSSLKYTFSLCNSKNIYKQSSVSVQNQNRTLLPQLDISEKSSVGKKSVL